MKGFYQFLQVVLFDLNVGDIQVLYAKDKTLAVFKTKQNKTKEKMNKKW